MTTERFIRSARLTAGGVTLETTGEGLRMAWRIRQDADSSSRTQILRIYNMARDLADALSEKGLPITLEAGYRGVNGDGELQLVFSGEITRADDSRIGDRPPADDSHGQRRRRPSKRPTSPARWRVPCCPNWCSLSSATWAWNTTVSPPGCCPAERLPDYTPTSARPGTPWTPCCCRAASHWYVIDRQVRFLRWQDRLPRAPPSC